jgi:hypothetical protein
LYCKSKCTTNSSPSSTRPNEVPIANERDATKLLPSTAPSDASLSTEEDDDFGFDLDDDQFPSSNYTFSPTSSPTTAPTSIDVETEEDVDFDDDFDDNTNSSASSTGSNAVPIANERDASKFLPSTAPSDEIEEDDENQNIKLSPSSSPTATPTSIEVETEEDVDFDDDFDDDPFSSSNSTLPEEKEVVSSVRPRCDNSKTEKFQIVGRQDKRTCGWYAYSNMCDTIVTDDDGGGVVVDVCQKSCGKCVNNGIHTPDSVSLRPTTESSPSTAPSINPTDGPSRQPSDVPSHRPSMTIANVRDATKSCDNIKTEKFQIVGRQDERTCGWYAYSNMCDNIVTDDDGGGVVSDVCQKSCGKCVHNEIHTSPSTVPSINPTATTDRPRCDNIKTAKFQIVGRQDERTCGWYADSNMCDNTVTDEDGGGVVSDVCQKSCGKCVRNDRGNRVGLRAIGSTKNIDKNNRDDRFKKQTTNNLRG